MSGNFTILEYLMILLAVTLVLFAALYFQLQLRDRRENARRRDEDRKREEEREAKREAAQAEQLHRLSSDAAYEREMNAQRMEEAVASRDAQWREERQRFEAEREEYRQVVAASVKAVEDLSASAGLSAGGYIVAEMGERERPLFHDLLKGFEDFAKLKGYHLSFSIDSSLQDRIAFKFTVKNDGVVVGPERVKRDFQEYLARVQSGDLTEFDNLPVVTSIEEHSLLVTLLKNRLSFLQHSYQLSQNAVQYYQSLINGVRTFPALPAPQVIVQTGGTMDSRNYTATNAQRLIQGDSNTFADSSVNIGQSFNERQERITKLDTVMSQVANVAEPSDGSRAVGAELGKVRNELATAEKPDQSKIKRWLENAKEGLETAKLGTEVVVAVNELMRLFGLQ